MYRSFDNAGVTERANNIGHYDVNLRQRIRSVKICNFAEGGGREHASDLLVEEGDVVKSSKFSPRQTPPHQTPYVSCRIYIKKASFLTPLMRLLIKKALFLTPLMKKALKITPFWFRV